MKGVQEIYSHDDGLRQFDRIFSPLRSDVENFINFQLHRRVFELAYKDVSTRIHFN